ncbi:energy transducer TonB [Hymenobacter sp. B1770]|uniref:energy transducer TonB n=1 Tax=Hymenobacter sp. B1770 TaxID=1718788 RepID=UPI003CF99538
MSPADSPFAPLPAPGPHPATEELRAYAAGTLPPAQQHRIEAHTLDCERCADLVDGFSMSDAATTDQSVAALRTRLQERIGVPQPVPVATRWAWPRLAAAAALLGVVATGVWTWDHRDDASTAARTEAVQPMASREPAPLTKTAPTPPTTPEAVSSSPPQKPPASDYAVTTPPKSTPLGAQQAARRGRPTSKNGPKRVVIADMESLADKVTTQEAVAVQEEALAPPTMAHPVAAPSESALSEKPTVADTLSAGRQEAVAGRAAMAKSSLLATADKAAWVTAAPMLASPSIKPAPVGGSPALRNYIRREAAAFEPENGARRIPGTVRVSFVVEADGKLSNLKVTRGLREDYDAEALRIVCEGPTWQPGISGGRRSPLPAEVTVPF